MQTGLDSCINSAIFCVQWRMLVVVVVVAAAAVVCVRSSSDAAADNTSLEHVAQSALCHS